MATFRKYTKKDGSVSHRAIIRIKKGGVVIHDETETFATAKAAKLWAGQREAELAKEDGLEKAKAEKETDVTVKKLIETYEEIAKPLRPYGRTKEAVLSTWKGREEGQELVTKVDANWLVDFCRKRVTVDKVKPATVEQDFILLRGVFAVAKSLLGINVGVSAFDEARPTLTMMGLAGKSDERERRPEEDEITSIVKFAYEQRKSPRHRGYYAPIDKILVFQMFSGRRISETCRFTWEDLDRDKQMVLIRDMKHPRKKLGNHIWVYVPNEAWAVIMSMPEGEPEDRIFPYNAKSLGTRYERLRAKLGYSHPENEEENLRLHDLRHECLSWLAEKNGLEGEFWDIPRIQLVSGHSNWNVLQRYVNLLTETPVDRWKDWEWKTKVLD